MRIRYFVSMDVCSKKHGWGYMHSFEDLIWMSMIYALLWVQSYRHLPNLQSLFSRTLSFRVRAKMQLFLCVSDIYRYLSHDEAFGMLRSGVLHRMCVAFVLGCSVLFFSTRLCLHAVVGIIQMEWMEWPSSWRALKFYISRFATLWLLQKIAKTL